LHNPAELGASVVETFGIDGMGERWLRAYGGLDHPNMLGGAVAAGMLVAVGLFFKNKIYTKELSSEASELSSKGLKLFYYFIILLFSLALFFTFSRGAWAGAIVGILLLLFIFLIKKDYLKQRGLLKIILAAGVLIFVLSNLYSDLVLTRLSKDTRLEIKSNTERMESFGQAEKMIKEKWFFGAGIGNYALALEQENSGRSSWDYQPVHNVFLLVWAETGTLGLLGFLGFLGFLGWNLIKKGKYFGLSILTALVIMMMVDHWYWSLHFGVLWFWMIVGIMVEDNYKI